MKHQISNTPTLEQSCTSTVQYNSECSEDLLSATTKHGMSTQLKCSLSDQMDTTDTITSPESDVPFDDIVDEMIKSSNHNAICKKHGYQILDKIADSLQGEIFLAKPTKVLCNSKKLGSYVTIKTTDKHLWKNKIAIQDGMSFCVEEDIVKESLLLKYCTVTNTPAGDYIVQYLDFFESDNSFYLVMEYVENGMNLKQFVQMAHILMTEGKLKLKDYQKTIKYIFWQLIATIRWMHNVLSCCHMDLNLENIMLKNATFIEGNDGFLKIGNGLAVRLCDFGVAEAFGNKVFDCWKNELTIDNGPYVSPQIYQNDKYDARAADMWSLGLMLFECLVGEPLYDAQDMWDEPENGYLALRTNSLIQYLVTQDLSQYFPSSSLRLLLGLLVINESKRFTANQMIEHSWFKAYSKKYYKRMNKKIESDSKTMQKQFESMHMFQFPFYK